jgi:plasmid stabilization system protein ParE
VPPRRGDDAPTEYDGRDTVLARLLLLTALTAAPAAAQTTFTVKELAEYRLTPAAFAQFERAGQLIAAATREDQALASYPLFSREEAVLGDAPEMATRIEARLMTDPRLSAALRAANISAREYTRFALSLFAARLAHGFMKAGVLRSVPPGVAADNVAFVEANAEAIATVLHLMGVEDAPPGDARGPAGGL